ncbi:MAG: hypothetical protein J6J97_09810, partial [Akkermansia sp.]|nr:hypothetical protein [Akkermansia sp.]
FVRGSDMFFVLPSVPPRGGSTLGYYYVALTGSEFLGLSARQIPIYRAEWAFSKMLLMFLLLTKSLGHMWVIRD